MKLMKENFWDQVFLRVTSSTIVSLITSLLSIAVVVFISISDPLKRIVEEFVPVSVLIVLLLIIFSLLILSFVYVFYLRKRLKPILIQALGVYWDQKANPYCPSCKTMLSNYAYHYSGSKSYPGMKCIACDNVVYFSDESKLFYKLGEARQIVKEIIDSNK